MLIEPVLDERSSGAPMPLVGVVDRPTVRLRWERRRAASGWRPDNSLLREELDAAAAPLSYGIPVRRARSRRTGAARGNGRSRSGPSARTGTTSLSWAPSHPSLAPADGSAGAHPLMRGGPTIGSPARQAAGAREAPAYTDAHVSGSGLARSRAGAPVRAENPPEDRQSRMAPRSRPTEAANPRWTAQTTMVARP